MKIYCKILFLLLSNIVYSQDHLESKNVNEDKSTINLRYNVSKKLGLGEFDDKINYSICIGFGADYFMSSRLSIETGVLTSYKNLFHGQSYRLEINCPNCEPAFIDAKIKSTSLISFDVPVIFSFSTSSKNNMFASLGVNNSLNIFYYQRIDKGYLSYMPLLFGKIPRYDLMFLLGASKNISKFNVGIYLSHNIHKLMKYNSIEDLNNSNINDLKFFIHGLTPSYYKNLSLRIKYHLNFK